MELLDVTLLVAFFALTHLLIALAPSDQGTPVLRRQAAIARMRDTLIARQFSNEDQDAVASTEVER